MENKYPSSDDSREDQMMLSCWGRFMLIFSRSKNQTKLIKNGSSSSSSSFRFSKSKKRGKQSSAFRYSPLSYAQNFDDGVEWEADDQDSLFRGFSSRYAAPFSSQSTNS